MKKSGMIILALLVVMAASVFADSLTGSQKVKITLLNQQPSVARAGDTVELRFTVENTADSSSSNVKMQIDDQYPFTGIDADSSRNIGTLYPGQVDNNYVNVIYKFKVNKDVVNGQYELRVKYQYDNGPWTTTSFYVDISNKEYAQISYVNKANLDPGKITDVNFTIVNSGNAPLQNMVFSWADPKGVILPVHSDNTRFIKFLDIGQSVILNYQMIADVNAVTGLYQLNLALSYESMTNATISSLKTTAGVFVGGQTDFEVSFSESTAGQTSLSVANIGNSPALSVAVSIPNQPNFRVTGSTSSIIGNLDKGDYTIVSFQVAAMTSGNGSRTGRATTQEGTPTTTFNRTFSRNQTRGRNMTALASNPGNLLVDISYTDTTGARNTVQKIVPIQFRGTTGSTGGFGGAQQATGSSSFSKYLPYGLILVIIVLGFLLYRKSKKK